MTLVNRGDATVTITGVSAQGVERLELPVRHGEGKLVTADEQVLEGLRERLGVG